MLEATFLIILCAYLLVLLAIGWKSRSRGSDEEFFIAGRSLDQRSVAFTIGATVVGGSAVIVTGSLVFAHGLAGLWYDIGGILGLLFLGFFVAPKIRKTGAHSLPDLIGRNYGSSGRTISSLVLVLVEIGWIALLMQAARFVLQVGLDLDPEIALMVSAGVFVGYTVIGGQKAVVRTDIVQMVLAIIALGAILVGLLVMGGGIRPSSLNFPVTDGFGIDLAIPAFLTFFLSHVVGPDIYSKVFSSRSSSHAARGVIGGALLKLMSSILVAMIALVGYSVYGSSIGGGSLIPTAANDTLPGIAFAIAMVGLLSIMLSSADSCLISGATFISWDLIGGRKGSITRPLSVLALGAAAYLVAFHSTGIIDTLNLTYTLYAAAIVPSVFLIIWRKKLGVNSVGAAASFILGGSGVISLYVLQRMDLWSGSILYIPLILSFVSVLIFSWGSSLVQIKSKPLPAQEHRLDGEIV